MIKVITIRLSSVSNRLSDFASIWSLTSSMKCVLKEKDLYSSCWSQNLILSLPFVSTPLSTSTCLPSPRPRGPYNHEKSSKAENLIAFSSLNLASSKISCKIPSWVFKPWFHFRQNASNEVGFQVGWNFRYWHHLRIKFLTIIQFKALSNNGYK